MKKTLRPIAVTLTVILTLTCLLSCARSAKSESMDMMYDSSMDMQSAIVESGKAEKPTSAGSVLTSGTADDSAASPAEFASKIIKTVHMDTETKEFDRAVAELDRLITENGGFIESASTNGQSLYHSDVYRRSAKYTVRIPAEKLNTFLAASEQLLNVTYSNTSTPSLFLAPPPAPLGFQGQSRPFSIHLLSLPNTEPTHSLTSGTEQFLPPTLTGWNLRSGRALRNILTISNITKKLFFLPLLL